MTPTELLYVVIASGSVIVALIVIFSMRIGKEKEPEKSAEVPKLEPEGRLPFKTKRSVTEKEVEDSKNKMRILTLEREILSYAIRRLYEAQAEGKISEAERDGLAEKYKEDMRRINEDISRGESIVALNELERMQDDLLKLFDERFGELNKRIEDLRMRSGIELPVEITEEKPELVEPSEAPTAVQERRRREAREKKPAPPEKTEAERKVEQIMAEVEKVLARLEQMEVSE